MLRTRFCTEEPPWEINRRGDIIHSLAGSWRRFCVKVQFLVGKYLFCVGGSVFITRRYHWNVCRQINGETDLMGQRLTQWKMKVSRRMTEILRWMKPDQLCPLECKFKCRRKCNKFSAGLNSIQSTWFTSAMCLWPFVWLNYWRGISCH